jgi:hypothetical protein
MPPLPVPSGPGTMANSARGRSLVIRAAESGQSRSDRVPSHRCRLQTRRARPSQRPALRKDAVTNCMVHAGGGDDVYITLKAHREILREPDKILDAAPPAEQRPQADERDFRLLIATLTRRLVRIVRGTTGSV